MEVANQELEPEVTTEPEVGTEPEVTTEPEGEPQELTDGEPQEPAPYEPNHKYNFMDEEFEFDDKVKGFIKTKEDEDLFRDMITAQKAHEKYKELGSFRDLETKLGGWDELDENSKSFVQTQKEIEQLGEMVQKGNIEQFREYLGIPKEKLLEWAINEAKATQDPAYGQELKQQYQNQNQNFNLQYQNKLMQNEIGQYQSQQNEAKLTSALENAGEVSQAYDNLVGKQGSFREAVINHGLAYYNQNGRDMSFEDCVKHVSGQFQGLVANNSVGTQQNPQTQVQQVNATPEKTVVINRNAGQTTIPNLQGGGNTPAKKQFKSLAELKAHARTLD